MKRKKNYNPFKMIGSWATAIIISLIAFLARGSISTTSSSFLGSSGTRALNLDYFIAVIVAFIFFFLVGWGINSIYRKVRK